MTFDAGVPNSGQSPGFYPIQNQTNMTRIKANINADHNFLDTLAVDEGAHKQTTFINRPTGYVPAFPTGTNAVLYTIFDANNQSQLHYFNGVTDEILTPISGLYPIRIQGRTVGAIPFNTTEAVTGLPAQYTGAGYVWIDGEASYEYSNVFLINGKSDVQQIRAKDGGFSHPSFVQVGTALHVKNNNVTGSKILWWSLILNVKL